MFQGVSRGSLSIAYPLLIPCLSLAARPDFYRVNTERMSGGYKNEKRDI